MVIDTRAEHALVDGQYAARRAGLPCSRRAARGRHPARGHRPRRGPGRAARHDEQMRVRHVVTEIARVEQFADLAATVASATSAR